MERKKNKGAAKEERRRGDPKYPLSH